MRAHDELAHLAALAEADHDQRDFAFPGQVEDLLGQIIAVGRRKTSAVTPAASAADFSRRMSLSDATVLSTKAPSRVEFDDQQLFIA